ncbi:hypothetical protein A6R70_23605 [Agrobacterium rubi]|uniref:hypothetical protein n=1 Tax=Agrobacterium rubi TaxID=28099 RepID=UPI00201B51F1|nr:hypothetical protein [Agrobacterium rubi]MCL6655265.1 hypothetical protein [Agrobacterium rubi]
MLILGFSTRCDHGTRYREFWADDGRKGRYEIALCSECDGRGVNCLDCGEAHAIPRTLHHGAPWLCDECDYQRVLRQVLATKAEIIRERNA